VQPTSEPQPGTSREPEAGPSSAPTHQSPTQENSPTRTPKAPAVAQSMAQSSAQSVESPASPEPEAAQEQTVPQPALVVPVSRPLQGAERDEKLEYFLQSKVGHYSDEFFEIRKIALAMGEGYAADLADRLCSFEKYSGENHMQLAKAGFCGTNRGNIVFCRECLLYAQDVEESDDAMLIHKICSPDCDFTKHWEKVSQSDQENEDTIEMIDRCRMIW
jgi:Inhibitor of Apoptosis domain